MIEVKKLQIVLWCGNAANQKALANKVAQQFDLIGIVIESKIKTKKKTIIEKIFSALDKIRFVKIDKAWFNMLKYYNSKYAEWPETKIYRTENLNSKQVATFTMNCNPDVILVSGTSLIRGELLQLKPLFGIINLHTGLSPYVKGGPNCTNWCIANNQFHLIGNTIMWINEGIDSGNIINTELTKFEGNEDLFSIHLKVMEHAHQLYLKVLNAMQLDTQKLPNQKQNEIAEGRTYYSKQWDSTMKKQLLKNLKNDNWKKIITSDYYKLEQQKLNLIK